MAEAGAGDAAAAARDAADEPSALTRLVHDLRSPLTVVEGLAHLLERDAERLDGEQRAAYAQRIKAAAADMRALIDRVG